MHPLAERVLNGERRAIARAISYVEDDHPDKTELMRELFPHTGGAQIIGITGSPGAGKSSLVDVLIRFLRQQKLTVGVVAVDPSSPFTGGALLGDRVRMQSHALDPDVFIRSMGSRGNLGGLSRATMDTVRILDAAGKDVIIVETVGVGQSELDIMHMADTVALVVTPAGGDAVQAFKAGIMEIADVFVVNKADLPGVEKVITELEQMLDLVKHDAEWRPPVVKTISVQNSGMEELWQSMSRHYDYLKQSGLLEKRRRDHIRREVAEIVGYHMQQWVREQMQNIALDPDFDPYTTAQQLLKQIIHKRELEEERR